MDDLAEGPVGRVFPELDFFSAGFPAFEISGGGGGMAVGRTTD